MMKAIVSRINEETDGFARLSERENRIYVRIAGVKEAYSLKAFMEENGFQDVYGTFDDGIYELGFSKL